ncbi:MAG: DUF1573 domain-containing protein [Chitinophagaceae bacterium]|nr:MAG: DUF1573 domain-containing protein [Chitinophagaceae bacterium]
MKKILFVCLAAGLFACGTSDQKAADGSALTGDTKTGGLTASPKADAVIDTANFTKIQWLDSISSNLGNIKEGQVVEVSYRFRNAGSKPLIFASVSASCGCTVPEKPEKPYAPGEEGVIKAKFDSKGRAHGEAQKMVYVQANTDPSMTTLNFKVNITD